MNLDQYLRPLNSPVTNRMTQMLGNAYESIYDTRRVKLKTSSVSIKNFIKESVSVAASGSFDTGDSLTVTSTLEPENLSFGAIPMGIPQTSIYQGTAAVEALQIYPKSGGSIDPANYIFDSGFDWGSAASDGSDVVAMVSVENIAAGTVSIYAVTKWKYIADTNGLFTN